MTVNADWDVNKYREEHESDDQWELRKAFLMKWKDDYPEERLVCLARVFTNMEFMGCRYPTEVMEEIARLSGDIAKDYRDKRKTRLQRTFVSASDAAADYCKRTTQKNTKKVTTPNGKKKVEKRKKIAFVPQQQSDEENALNNEHDVNISLENSEELSEIEPETKKPRVSDEKEPAKVKIEPTCAYTKKQKDLKLFYENQMSEIKCLDSTLFNENMFDTEYGKFVLIILPWNDISSNIINSCTACDLSIGQSFKERNFTLTVNGKIIAQAEGSKKKARDAAFNAAWNYFRQNAISLMIKDEWIAKNGTTISMKDMSITNELGDPFEDSVAINMMKLMGWKGGGLGIDSQGIAEPIKPVVKMGMRTGLGHNSVGLTALRRAGSAMMKRHENALDGDLVFSTSLTNKERAVLHQCAVECDLESKSYGKRGRRFLVVSNKVQPFELVQAVTQQGGDTPKYRVFIPEHLANIK